MNRTACTFVTSGTSTTWRKKRKNSSGFVIYLLFLPYLILPSGWAGVSCKWNLVVDDLFVCYIHTGGGIIHIDIRQCVVVDDLFVCCVCTGGGIDHIVTRQCVVVDDLFVCYIHTGGEQKEADPWWDDVWKSPGGYCSEQETSGCCSNDEST